MIQVPPLFLFAPRWKEELVVTSKGGSFVLPFWMGSPTVELPTKERWHEVAPDWARDHWDALHKALEQWCKGNGAALEITETAWVSKP
ncbi:MAG TPA: hypothetical protein PKA03_04235 [Tabrizicola sp.]|nr:hypothetical protein [Tabrizicola sp.]